MAKSAENTGVLEILQGVIDGVKAGTVFGQPIEKDGVTVLPVARISGGGGGGKGQDAGGREAEGAGGGLGLSARPVGVYVIRDGKVSWSPAVDVTRVILGGQLVGVVALLTLRALFKIIGRRMARREAGPTVPKQP
ncbi:spore germination protein GerW family protein [Kribbella sp. NBC_01510]|uniref:spore germination protein GerW family protein n=1 Tax=unclassified Kribbella TaxID=2644121 RepID=UPI002E3630AF|nr:spore germination protein GerW family protein [Kribbella sp. NBC_01484]